VPVATQCPLMCHPEGRRIWRGRAARRVTCPNSFGSFVCPGFAIIPELLSPFVIPTKESLPAVAGTCPSRPPASAHPEALEGHPRGPTANPGLPEPS
jgi:hypothetical protein